MNMLI
jgi:hypothetical protein